MRHLAGAAPAQLARTVRGLVRRGAAVAAAPSGAGKKVARYWTGHNVTAHRRFGSAAESLEYFHWRNDQYFNYIALMPVTGQHGKAVLDFGCGPGNDIVGFGTYSAPARLIGIDVSTRSLAEARERLALHDIACELLLHAPESTVLPLDDGAVDYVHCSGVLHHTPDPSALLREFRRVLRPDGAARIMVYNYDSLWVHLYVAYQKQLVEQALPGLDLRAAFAKTTDGPDCPISRVFRPAEFIALAEAAGFSARFLGAAISMHEAALLPKRFDAIADPRLPAESRRFLAALTLDEHGLPMHEGHYAGVDGCYLLSPRA
jgi:ubiquinone/menaquinone biosynthesis C-methylase UbiE